MGKFSHLLHASSLPLWQGHYINYTHLKHLLSDVFNANAELAGLSARRQAALVAAAHTQQRHQQAHAAHALLSGSTPPPLLHVSEASRGRGAGRGGAGGRRGASRRQRRRVKEARQRAVVSSAATYHSSPPPRRLRALERLRQGVRNLSVLFPHAAGEWHVADVDQPHDVHARDPVDSDSKLGLPGDAARLVKSSSDAALLRPASSPSASLSSPSPSSSPPASPSPSARARAFDAEPAVDSQRERDEWLEWEKANAVNPFSFENFVVPGTYADAEERIFHLTVERELIRVNRFFADQCRQLTVAVNAIIRRYKGLSPVASYRHRGLFVLLNEIEGLYEHVLHLKNYRTLNYTALVLIMQKHDRVSKLSPEQSTLRIMARVHTSYFYRSSQWVVLMQLLEDLYSSCYQRYYRVVSPDASAHAVAHLRAVADPKPPPHDPDADDFDAANSGGAALGVSRRTVSSLASFGAAVALLIVFLVQLAQIDPDHDRARLNATAPVFRGVGLLLLWCWGYTGVLFAARVLRMNLIYLLDLDPRHALGFRAALEYTSFGTLAWVGAANLFANQYLRDDEVRSSGGVLLFIVFLAGVVLALNPLNWCRRPTRAFCLSGLCRSLFAPLTRIDIHSVFIAEQLTSLVVPAVDVLYASCFYVTGDFVDSDGSTCGSFAFSAHWVVAILVSWIRAMQELHRFTADRDTMHRINACKALSALLTSALSIFAYHFQGAAMGMFVMSAAFTLGFHVWWDMKRDLGLWRDDDKGHLLRLFDRKWLYAVFAAVNLVLRVAWLFTIAPAAFEIDAFNDPYWFALLGAAEVVRRSLWNFLFLENEQVHNAAGFRPVKFVPLRLHIDEPPTVEHDDLIASHMQEFDEIPIVQDDLMHRLSRRFYASDELEELGTAFFDEQRVYGSTPGGDDELPRALPASMAHDANSDLAPDGLALGRGGMGAGGGGAAAASSDGLFGGQHLFYQPYRVRMENLRAIVDAESLGPALNPDAIDDGAAEASADVMPENSPLRNPFLLTQDEVNLRRLIGVASEMSAMYGKLTGMREQIRHLEARKRISGGAGASAAAPRKPQRHVVKPKPVQKQKKKKQQQKPAPLQQPDPKSASSPFRSRLVNRRQTVDQARIQRELQIRTVAQEHERERDLDDARKEVEQSAAMAAIAAIAALEEGADPESPGTTISPLLIAQTQRTPRRESMMMRQRKQEHESEERGNNFFPEPSARELAQREEEMRRREEALYEKQRREQKRLEEARLERERQERERLREQRQYRERQESQVQENVALMYEHQKEEFERVERERRERREYLKQVQAERRKSMQAEAEAEPGAAASEPGAAAETEEERIRRVLEERRQEREAMEDDDLPPRGIHADSSDDELFTAAAPTLPNLPQLPPLPPLRSKSDNNDDEPGGAPSNMASLGLAPQSLYESAARRHSSHN